MRVREGERGEREGELKQQKREQSDTLGGGRTAAGSAEPVSPFEPGDPALTWTCHPACTGSGGALCERSGLCAGQEKEEKKEEEEEAL